MGKIPVFRAAVWVALMATPVLSVAPAGASGSADGSPLQVCTELVPPHAPMTAPVARGPVLRGDAPDGRCDVILFLPLALADDGTLEALLAALRDAEATPSGPDALAGMACDELARIAAGTSEVAARASLELLWRCMTCDELEAMSRQEAPWIFRARCGEEVPTAPPDASAEQVLVGNLECLALGTARTRIEEVGLVVGSVTPPDDRVDDGWLVHEQLPRPGDVVPAGSAVDLFVADPLVACPAP